MATKKSSPKRSSVSEVVARKAAATNELAASIPFNVNKEAEYGKKASRPPRGQTSRPADPMVAASTVSEANSSMKTGEAAAVGFNPGNASLQRARVDSGNQALTTNQGIPLADNQSSLKAGLRGPTLLEDFILREKITHFDHERIPERVVHARGSAAHGYFECYKALPDLTRAAPFANAGKRTPVFVRFSTVAGERGSTDTARDVRGFAVKFYTDEGNWDLVGNNMPIFFIQDAMKFPDLVHSVKPEPHHGMPQAASAHDTFWDFVSLMPESTHMLMWAMSDRGIPRSYRMMQGFGVHTFRLINASGESVFCKFHWNPTLGTHSLVWDEAVKISGADSDFHRRDLWEAIEAGEFPSWELGLQIFTEAQAEKYSFDVLDATKLIPEELVPVRPVGRMVLDRNPDNFFAETEQVAFCTANMVPGIDVSNDPLLQGRHHSYLDTQLLRLGGPNFHQLPINASLAQVHNNQRDGLHQQGIPRGRVSYEPNSLGGGCPFQAGMRGFTSFPEALHDDKMRGKPERFADHYSQATLFWESQSPEEQTHIVDAFRFELTKVQTPAIRERTVAMLANVASPLAEAVAEGLGIAVPAPLPRPGLRRTPEIERSPALSLLARPGDGGVRTRCVAILVADGVDGASLRVVGEDLTRAGAVPRFVGQKLGNVKDATGQVIVIDGTLATMPAVLFDGMIVPDGEIALLALGNDARAKDFLKDQYRHGKTILAIGAAGSLLAEVGIPDALPSGEPDPGIVKVETRDSRRAAAAFIEALAKHRHPQRETDPPLV